MKKFDKVQFTKIMYENKDLINEMLRESDKLRKEREYINSRINEYKRKVLSSGDYKVREDMKPHLQEEFIKDELYDFAMESCDALKYSDELYKLFSNDQDILQFIDIESLKTVEAGIMYASVSIMHNFEIERKLFMLLEGHEDIKQYIYDPISHDKKLDAVKQLMKFVK